MFQDLPTIQFLITYSQWCSQDEQVTWVQHGHTQCMRNMHLQGNLGHAPASKNLTLRSLRRQFLATNTILSVLTVCLLHVHMKLAIADANNWLLTLAFTRAPVDFMWAQAWVCPGVASPTAYSTQKWRGKAWEHLSLE